MPFWEGNTISKYIAPGQFYRDTARIAVPVALQSLLSSCLGLIDTMMVSRIGMVSAVGTATQMETLSHLLTLGATSGTAIFLAQYAGAGNDKQMKKSFGLSLILSGAIGLLFTLLSAFFGEAMMAFYAEDSAVIAGAVEYLDAVKYGFLPGCMAFAFSYGFKAEKNARVPLYVDTMKMLLNVVLNYAMIFGRFGCPAMGVRGAAIATAISQWVGVFVYLAAAKVTRQRFMGTLREMFALEAAFVKRVLGRIYALILNEVFFGFGDTLYIKAFSVLGTGAMDAYFVGNKIASVFYIMIMGITSAATIMLGNTLGKGDIEGAKRQSDYFLGFAGMLSAASVVLIVLFARPMVLAFGFQDPAAIRLSVQVVQVLAIKIALRLFIVVSFSALRAGGDSKFLTFLDSGVMWLVGIPLAFFAVRGLGVTSITTALLLTQLEHLVRMTIGIHRLKSGKWAVNLTH